MRVPPLNWLRSFEAAARHLSFTQAAAELGLSQVAVSKQIRQLEDHLGERLFIRHARSLSLTRSAEAWLPKLRAAFEGLADGTLEVFGNAPARKRVLELRIRCAVAFATVWLAPRLPAFQALHPDISIRTVSSLWNEPDTGAEHDFDIRYGTGGWSDGRADRLSFDTITPLCAPALADDLSREGLQALGDHPLIHVMGYRQGWPAWLRAAGVGDLPMRAGTHVDTSLMGFEVAAAGGGIIMARASLATLVLQQGRLVAPFDLHVEIEEAFHLVAPRPPAPDSPAELFRTWALAQVAAERLA